MAASGSGEVVIVPRNFVLLEELEKAEKGQTDMNISYGLADAADIELSLWQCTILGPLNTPVENRIISLLVQCGPGYPNEAPTVIFQSKINFPFVDDKGQVVKKHVPHLHQWNRSYTIEKLLINIRGLFGKPEFRKLTNQPPEGETF